LSLAEAVRSHGGQRLQVGCLSDGAVRARFQGLYSATEYVKFITGRIATP
jgi:hypothetical protein